MRHDCHVAVRGASCDSHCVRRAMQACSLASALPIHREPVSAAETACSRLEVALSTCTCHCSPRNSPSCHYGLRDGHAQDCSLHRPGRVVEQCRRTLFLVPRLFSRRGTMASRVTQGGQQRLRQACKMRFATCVAVHTQLPRYLAEGRGC